MCGEVGNKRTDVSEVIGALGVVNGLVCFAIESPEPVLVHVASYEEGNHAKPKRDDEYNPTVGENIE